MRKKIAIKPHETRGHDIIKILEEIGGVNVDNHKGNLPIEWDSAYYVYGDNTIQFARTDFLSKLEYKIYTLEEYEMNINNRIENTKFTDSTNRR